MTGRIVVLGLAAAIGSGCATFNAPVMRPDRISVSSREGVAGTTLMCSASSQRHAIWLLVGASVASMMAGVIASQAGSDPSVAVTSAAFSGLSFGLTLGAAVAFGNSIAYQDRAGAVLAGLSPEGCIPDDLPADVLQGASAPVEAPSPRGGAVVRPAQGASTPSNGSGDTTPATARCSAADIEAMKASGMSAGAITRACGE